MGSSIEHNPPTHEEICNLVASNISVTLKNFNYLVKSHIRELRKAKTPEKFMEIKTKIIALFVQRMPIQLDQDCYFCIQTYNHCSRCSYKKANGCCHKTRSSHGRIYKRQIDLINTIQKEFPIKKKSLL
jgi:hypothetical protein